MPTMAMATVVCHLQADPASGESARGETFARFRAWTKDSVKAADGSRSTAFTQWSGCVFGKEAEWLLENGRKGSLLAVSGSVRVGAPWTDRDGKARVGIDFVRVSSCMVLDRKEADVPDSSTAEPSRRDARDRPRSVPAADAGGHDEPPF